MANINQNRDLNLIGLMADSLLKKIHGEIFNRVMADVLNEFREKAEPIIKREVEKVTFEGAQSIKDHLRIRDELCVYFSWRDDEKAENTLK